MAKPKKDYRNIGIKADVKTVEQLNEMRDEIGLSLTKAIERAVDRYYKMWKETGKF